VPAPDGVPQELAPADVTWDVVPGCGVAEGSLPGGSVSQEPGPTGVTGGTAADGVA